MKLWFIAQISVSFIRSQMQETVSEQQPNGDQTSASPAFSSLPENNLINVIKVRELQLVWELCVFIIIIYLFLFVWFLGEAGGVFCFFGLFFLAKTFMS